MRVDPIEVETVLADHPRVAACRVIDVPGPNASVGLVAYCVSHDPPSPAELREYVARRVPDFMVPMSFTVIDEFPLTQSGKLDRAALLRLAVRPQNSTSEPLSAVERRMLGVWRDLLGVEAVGLHQSFFELGGHSLLIVQLQQRILAEFGHEFPIARLFEHPTVYALCRALDAGEPEPDASALAERARERARLQRSARQARRRPARSHGGGLD